MLTAQEIYTATRTLSLPERLRLAALILEELHRPQPQNEATGLAGYDAAWSDEDIRDFRQHSARYLHLMEASPGTEQDDALPPLDDLLKMKTEQSFLDLV